MRLTRSISLNCHQSQEAVSLLLPPLPGRRWLSLHVSSKTSLQYFLFKSLECSSLCIKVGKRKRPFDFSLRFPACALWNYSWNIYHKLNLCHMRGMAIMRNYSMFSFLDKVLFMSPNVDESHRSIVSNLCQHSGDRKMKLLTGL